MSSLNQQASESRIHVYAGRRGAGKSYLMARHTEKLIESGHFANCVVFDPMVCLPDWQSLADEHKMRLRYIEFDFTTRQPKPGIPFGKPTSRNDVDWRRTLYVFDEIDLLCDPNKIHSALACIINYSRHWGCTVLANFRRFARIHKDLEGLATDYYIFQMVAPRDTNAVESILSGIPDTEGREVSVARVKALPVYHHIHVTL